MAVPLLAYDKDNGKTSNLNNSASYRKIEGER